MSFFIFSLFILLNANQRDIYDIITNTARVDPKNAVEFILGVYMHRPIHLDRSIIHDQIPIMSSIGQSLTCHVPRLQPNGTVALSGSKPEISQEIPPPQKQPKQAKEAFFLELIKSRSSCFSKRKDYWTYEICLDHVKQFHGKEKSPVFDLGRYSGVLDMENVEHKQLLANVKFIPDNQNQFIHTVYLKGDEDRKTLVTWLCDKNKQDLISQIQEVSTHNYHMIIFWSELCEYEQEEKEVGSQPLTPLSADNLSSYLQQLKGDCIKVSGGWWTYEFCYRQKIMQYHDESTRDKTTNKLNVKRTVNYILGQKSDSGLTLHKFDGKKNSNFVEEIYDSGTVCDITNTPRTVSVRYRCMQDVVNLKVKVPDEVSSCVYHMDVHVPDLCLHPDFQTETTSTYEIVCYPEGNEKAPPEEKDEDEEEIMNLNLGDQLNFMGSSMQDVASLLEGLFNAGDGNIQVLVSDDVGNSNTDLNDINLDDLDLSSLTTVSSIEELEEAMREVASQFSNDNESEKVNSLETSNEKEAAIISEKSNEEEVIISEKSNKEDVIISEKSNKEDDISEKSNKEEKTEL